MMTGRSLKVDALGVGLEIEARTAALSLPRGACQWNRAASTDAKEARERWLRTSLPARGFCSEALARRESRSRWRSPFYQSSRLSAWCCFAW